MLAKRITMAVAFAAAVTGSQAALHAQVRPVSTAGEASRADALHRRAAALFSSPPRYAEAARLLVDAAHTRDATDVAAVKELITAARLYWYAHEEGLARSTMTLAAERALEFGELNTAAHAYLDGAFLAIAARDWEDVSRFTMRAEMLASSDLLGGAERDAILRRINPARIALSAAGR